MEKKTNVKAVKVNYLCDNCKQENMIPTGRQVYMGSSMFEHQCPHCGFRKNLPKQYPLIDFEEIE